MFTEFFQKAGKYFNTTVINPQVQVSGALLLHTTTTTTSNSI